jgi:hypothetical protein
MQEIAVTGGPSAFSVTLHLPVQGFPGIRLAARMYRPGSIDPFERTCLGQRVSIESSPRAALIELPPLSSRRFHMGRPGSGFCIGRSSPHGIAVERGNGLVAKCLNN